MPKTQNQKYLMKVDLGGGQYRYLYTQEEVAAYKAGKTGGGNQSHGESHYQYQAHRQKGGRELARENQLKLAPKNHSGDTSSSRYSYQRTKNTTSDGRVTGTRTGVYNGANSSEPQRTISRDRYGTRKRQLANAPENSGGQRGYTYQTKRNKAGVAETRTIQPTGRIRSKANVDRTKTSGYRAQTNRNQLSSAPKNSGGTSSSDNYRYVRTSKSTDSHIGRKQRLLGKGSATVTSREVVSGSKGYNVNDSSGKRVVTPKTVKPSVKYNDSERTKKVKKTVSKAKSTVKSTGKNIAKNYDNATTKIADKALKATPKAKKAIKSAAKNYDNATTKMANAAWDATHSKTAKKVKKTVTTNAKKASNALTKAWNNLFKKKKKK